ncbi:MAG: hypothetical protein ABRQ39_10075 [Candidatus Eremiobacterota bacterium]
MHEVTVSMFGPRGVGKTSLLTTMYERFESDTSGANLQITPDMESASILQDRLGELKSLFDREDTFFEAGDQKFGIQGTEEKRTFVFELGKLGEKPTLKLKFIDFPGKYISSSATAEEKSSLKDILEKSHALLVAIDTPSLMERHGKYNESINRPAEVTEFFKRVYQEGLKEPRLIVFAPIKCEKYIKNNQSEEVVKKIKTEYKRLFDLFKSDNLRNYIVTVITPVQTTGNVVFSHITSENEKTHFYFTKEHNEARYDPKDSEQPLRYLLRFLLKLHLKQQETGWGIFSFLRSWLGIDKYLRDAITRFTDRCKKGNGFEILQGYDKL